MTPEIRTFVDSADYCRASVEKLATMLPPDDAALEALIAETVAGLDGNGFVFITMAAFSSDRPVQARHLEGALRLMPEKWTLGVIALHMQGDIAAPLVKAIVPLRFNPEVLSTAIYLAARQQVRNGEKVAPSVIAAARSATRTKDLSTYDSGMLRATALLAGEPGLRQLTLEKRKEKCSETEFDSAVKHFTDQMIALWSAPPISLVPAQAKRTLAEGTTMRRAVSKVGRNDPCPCGSGKKYKHCCVERDQERLRHSTHVAGVTDAELAANPEPYLTYASLDTYPPSEVARFDPLKIQRELRVPFLAVLCRARLLDVCATTFEKLGFDEDLIEAWDEICIRMAQLRRKDLIERMQTIPGYTERAKKLGAVQLLLSEGNPAAAFDSLEESIFHNFRYNDPAGFRGMARTLMKSRLAAIGILIARGTIPLLPKEEAVLVMDELLQARDQLGLSPDDPISDVLDERLLKDRAGDEKSDEALGKAQRRLEAKMQEVQRYKDSVERLQKELARREQTVAAAATTSVAPVNNVSTDTNEPAVKEMREKVEHLKTLLKHTHNERNQLRRELREAHEENQSLRKQAPATKQETSETEREEDLRLPQEMEANHPIRIIEFPDGFQSRLASLPRSVARGTIAMAGRLAAGEPAAFVGAVRLKAIPSITRQRIGIDFRLLFRLLPDRLQIVDLIPRQDLERKIKTLL
jgi:hypothetical protein